MKQMKMSNNKRIKIITTNESLNRKVNVRQEDSNKLAQIIKSKLMHNDKSNYPNIKKAHAHTQPNTMSFFSSIIPNTNTKWTKT